LYIADQNDWVIRRISGGIITTVAGTGKPGFSGDNGQATKAMLGGPEGVAVDASGNLYIADTGNQRIRYVNTGGIITTIAGTGATRFSGDGGAATAATFSTPVGVSLDASGNVYVADEFNNRIRRFVPGGAIATFAGTTISVGDGGPSTQARIEPWSVAVDSSGNLYIADRLEQRVRKVTPSGTITTLAGNGQAGGGGDNGPANLAALNTPNGVAVDAAGNVYIADAGNNAIRPRGCLDRNHHRVRRHRRLLLRRDGDRWRRRTGNGRHPLLPRERGSRWVGQRVFNRRRAEQHIPSGPSRTPGDHRREDQHLGWRRDQRRI
jgi:hypothetical protein